MVADACDPSAGGCDGWITSSNLGGKGDPAASKTNKYQADFPKE